MKSRLNMYPTQKRLLGPEDEPKYPIKGGRDNGAHLLVLAAGTSPAFRTWIRETLKSEKKETCK